MGELRSRLFAPEQVLEPLVVAPLVELKSVVFWVPRDASGALWSRQLAQAKACELFVELG